MANQVRSDGVHGRAMRGVEACAWVLAHAVEAWAVAGGEGARRLAAALEAVEGGRAARLGGEGADAARAAAGAAAAGRRVALLASGEAFVGVLPALREMVRLGLPVVVVVPSHGDETGRVVPSRGPAGDVGHGLGLPVGVVVAGDAEQAADLTLVAVRAAGDRGAPWVVAFDLADVGLAYGVGVLPARDLVTAWAAGGTPSPAGGAGVTAAGGDAEGTTRYLREAERFVYAFGAATREAERNTGRKVTALRVDGVRDAEVVLVSAGASALGARQAIPYAQARYGRKLGAVQVLSLRPFPAAELVKVAWRARVVLVHEPLPEPLGTGGRLTDSVKAAFADAITWHPGYGGIGRVPPVVTVLSDEPLAPEAWLEAVQAMDVTEPPRWFAPSKSPGAEGGVDTVIELAVAEPARDESLRLVVDWLGRTATAVRAHAHEPSSAGLRVGGERAVGPTRVLFATPGGGYTAARLEALPRGALVALAGDFPDQVLAESMRVAAPRGVRVVHVASGGGAPVALAGVLLALLEGEGAGEAREGLRAALASAGTSGVEDVVEAAARVASGLRSQL